MNRTATQLLDNMQKKMGAYVALYNYRLLNLSVKASPEALLSVEVEVDGARRNIEHVAQARNAPEREDQFEIYPLEGEYLFPILRGLKASHPEYKIEVKDLEEENGMESEDEEKYKYILATMPPVDDARHEVLMDAVAALSDECDGKLKATFSYFTAQIAAKLVGVSSKEIDEAKDAMQQVKDSYDDLLKQFRADKEKEIEDAYQLFQAKKAELQAELAEKQAALGEKAGQQMKWSPDDE